MSPARKTAPKRPRPSSARVPAAPPETPAEDSGLGDVPPPLVWERTAAAAEDEGFDAATAAVFAAVAAVDVFCVAEISGRTRHRLGAVTRAAELAEQLLADAGAGEEEFTHLFAPRLPFDVLLGAKGRLTAADLFLGRWGDELPREAVRAVRALVRARDTVARATWSGRSATVVDLATGRALPGPALLRRGTRPFVCRLVRVGSAFVPLAVERVASRVTDEELLAEVRGAARLGRDVLKAAGLRLLGTGKGVGFGARVLAAGEQADPARRPATRRPARPRRGDRGTPGDSR